MRWLRKLITPVIVFSLVFAVRHQMDVREERERLREYSNVECTDTKCHVEDCTRSHGSAGFYCNLHSCGEDDCHEKKGDNGTVYCDYHAEIYVKEQGYSPCEADDCMRRQNGNAQYCTYHRCEEEGCLMIRMEDTDYCEEHQIVPTEVSEPEREVPIALDVDDEAQDEVIYPDDPYDVYAYDDVEDFYYDNSEDFDGFEDAETYYEDAWRDFE